MSFTVSKIRPGEDVRKVEMMENEFFSTNPLKFIFELPEKGSAPPHETHHPKDFYVKAEDSEGMIVGLAINKCRAPTSNGLGNDVIGDLFSFLEVDAKLNELPDHTMELVILVVGMEWRRRGVARRLAEESTKVAREAGFKVMWVCCTSEFTAMLVRGLGWREHYRLAYQDYPRVSGRDVFIKPHPPHDNIYYYFIDL